MKITENLTDNAVLAEIGKRLTRRRLELDLTQSELAERAGVSKRTLERLENGATTQLSGFIRIVRGLSLLHRIDSFIPGSAPGPMELLENEGRERKRARSGKKKNPGKELWKWGDSE